MTRIPSFPRAALLVAPLLGCVASGAPSPRDADLEPELRRLGIAEVLETEAGAVLLDAAGAELGRVVQDGPSVMAWFDGQAAVLRRQGQGVVAECDGGPAQSFADASGLLEALAVASSSAACRRTLTAAALVSELTTARAPGCTLQEVDGASRLSCDDEAYEDRLLDMGGGCDCREDFSGYCAPQCWVCTDYHPFDGCSSGGGGGGGGGGDPGGGGVDPGGSGGGEDGGDGITCPSPRGFPGYGFGVSEEEARAVATYDAVSQCYGSGIGWCAAQVDDVEEPPCQHWDTSVTCTSIAYCSYQPL